MWYPDKEFVVKIHTIVLLEPLGGFEGFERGINIFDYILEEVKTTKGIYRKAAVLLRRLVTDRIFKDGNHRTSYEVTKTFLEKNGKKMKFTNKEDIITFIKCIRRYNINEIEVWLKDGKIP